MNALKLGSFACFIILDYHWELLNGLKLTVSSASLKLFVQTEKLIHLRSMHQLYLKNNHMKNLAFLLR
uniref:Uncharacterized protein n=1 Tax=Arundo donax TaxID=35708 RepID=A0A0A9TPC2_ARUDO